MKIQIKPTDVPFIEKSIGGDEAGQAFIKTLNQRLTGNKGTSIALDIEIYLSDEQIAKLKTDLAAVGNKSLMNQFSLYDRLANNADTKISRLIHLEEAITAWLLADCSKGWIFHEQDGQLQPYVVTSVARETPMHGEPYVSINLDANAPKIKGRDPVYMANIKFSQNNLPSTVTELLASQGYRHETPELHAQYEKDIKRFGEIVDQPNAQFRLQPGTYKPTTGYTNLALTHSQRVINDETLLERHIRCDAEYAFWSPSAKKSLNPPPGAFTDIPTIMKHLIYNLEVHEEYWAPSNALVEYAYDKDAATKIILPEDHRELIDILTEDEDVLIEDVVENKSGGNLVLLRGEAGLGKTLLVEIYTEVMERPLYRLPASQLGLDAITVEKQLAVVYANAQRWNAVVFVDEADIYIRKRSDDLLHNALIGAMLVALERQNVLTFMATNRVNDIDEAIESRCIAIVNFRHPDDVEAQSIWRIQADHIGVKLSDETISSLVEHYAKADKKTAGRDIRALLKLAYRYQLRRNKEATKDLIIQLGAFKGF